MSLNIKEVIFNFEKQFDPFQYQVDGYSVWPVFRFTVAEWLKISEGNFNKRARVASNKVQRWMNRLAAVPGTLRRLYRAVSLKDQVDILCLTSTDRLRDYVGDSYKNCYFDFFYPPIENMLSFYEITKYRERLKPDQLYIDDKLLPLAVFFARPDFKKSKTVVNELLSALNTFLSGTNCEISKQKWDAIWSRHIAQRLYFKWLLGQLNPSLLLVECAYGKEGAIMAAKSLNIPVWELQHGIIYDGHMAYTYAQEVIDNQYVLPFPDKVLTFGEYFSSLLPKLNYCQREDAVAIGLPRIEFYRRTLFSNKVTQKQSPLKVLISSQWIIVNQLSVFLKQVLPLPLEDILLTVKPHPLETCEHIERYSNLGNKVKIADPSASFYELLSDTHIHCSVFSTTLFESVGLGVPTVILNLEESGNAFCLHEKNAAVIINTPGEFQELIEKVKHKRSFYNQWVEQTNKSKAVFWAKDPAKNFHQLLSTQPGEGNCVTGF